MRSTTLRLLPLLAAGLLFADQANAQLSYTKGQTVAPAYEGFEVNPDGSYNLLFGYMNRNWAEELDVPVGPDGKPSTPIQGDVIKAI